MLPKVSKQRIVYSIEPSNSDEYTRNLDRQYSRYALTKMMERAGDTIRDISQLLQDNEFDHSAKEIGGFGSVHQYIARKR